MIKYLNLCVDCTARGRKCIGEECENNKPVPVHICEKCGNVLDVVYEAFGAELCERCLKALFRKDC